MDLIIGFGLAIGIGLLASWVGLDRDRAFYPTIMIVIASYYGLFAIMAGSVETLTMESLVIGVFAVVSLVAFKSSLWWLVAALLVHGVFDVTHGHFIANAGVPVWWPGFCLAYDAGAAAYLAWLLLSRRKLSAAS